MNNRIFIFILIFGLTGCMPIIKSSTYHNHASEYHKIVEMTVRIHIVGNRSQFPISQRMRDVHPRANGWAFQNEIWILGYRLPNGKIRIYDELLGHEITHMLNLRDLEIENPDIKRTFLILK